ncbi:hypothetical protein FEM48_Zijuj02G0200200 [Ziziphus jujuba var. spinosa]|uniref:Uncharacterized protein n=1 Tax=Ziziphus jujuba var. spinosa TaxID=714518 RepID=A0A978VXP7_ZIZJJ|nr:hypothetical protein FEM48_Zijuj02G0200200 [Ziziphus jujuba var. spinosa]
MAKAPQIAILGAGIFVKTQYIPRLAEISELVFVKAIWSRSEESARGAVEVAQKSFPGVECKWGDKGLDEILEDDSILGVAVALAGQAQVDVSLRVLRAGKHVLQEKPAAACKHFKVTKHWFDNAAIIELENALAHYNSILTHAPSKPIWAVAENYRFEPALVEGKKLISEIGDMMSVQLVIEGSMNSSNPYFSSSWRRNFSGGFILDMGVHFIAGLRMLVGCDVVSVSATTSHVDKTLPPPDNISSLFQLENGCSGVFVMVVSSRVVGSKGTIQIERGNHDGRHGYVILVYGADGQSKSSFYPFSGVTDEFKSFIHDISQASLKKGSPYEAEPRLSYVEGARDVAILEAMLESGSRQGAPVHVKKF